MTLFQKRFRLIGWSAPLIAVLLVACDGELLDASNSNKGDSAGPSEGVRPSEEAPPLKEVLLLKDASILENLRREFPKARLKVHNNRVRFIDGDVSASHDTPEQSAEALKSSMLRAFKFEENDLVPLRPVLEGSEAVAKTESIGLMYDRSTGEYKFRLYRFGQRASGIPVYDAELSVLVKNEPGYPVALVTSSLRDLGDFEPSALPRLLKINRDISLKAARTDAGTKASRHLPSTLDSYSEPEFVIFAGAGKEDVSPRLAMRYIGETEKELGAWRFIADADTGEILNIEDQVHSTNIWGRVMGNVTVDPVASECAPEVSVPLPYSEVSIPGVSNGFTNSQGWFVLSNPGTTPMEVDSTLWGRYFDIWNYLGDDEMISSTVTPPGPAYFLQNQPDNDEHVIAQANAYYHLNIARSTLLRYDPDYPFISSQENFEADTNGDITYMFGMYCPADARYRMGRIIFCESGAALSGEIWTNTAFGTIAYHEYAHHILASAGNYADNAEYAEGFGDAFAVLIAGDSRYARGYLKGNCSSVMRNADNDCQYDPTNCTTNCGDHAHIHDCGRLFSGIIWDLREALKASHPTDYMDILFPLFIAQGLNYPGSGEIDGDILTVMLTLDDNDGNIYNGTPHSAELCSAFEAHGIDCPITPARPCDGICSNPVVFSWSGSYQSGNLQTGAVCRETTQNAAGGNCGNFVSPRTLSVNGTVMTCNNQNWTSMPAERNGGYCVTTTSGNYPYAFFTLF